MAGSSNIDRYSMRNRHLRPTRSWLHKAIWVLCAFILCTQALTVQGLVLTSLIADPGTAHASFHHGKFRLWNRYIEGVWEVSRGELKVVSMTNLLNRRAMPVPKRIFELMVENDAPITNGDMKVVTGPALEKITGSKEASRLAERFDGQQFTVHFKSRVPGLNVIWRVVLRDGSNYFRQELTIVAQTDLRLSCVRLIDMFIPGASVAGVVKGSPVIAGNVFFGFEHPISECRITNSRVICGISRELPLKAGHNITYSAVAGVTPLGQLRRGFLNYIERERAHPYRTFLTYNSWYDIGFHNKYDESSALNVIHTFGTQLVEKRGVKLDSFLFDDGWDDDTTLWHFNKGFPHGFTPLKSAASEFGAAPGVWLSPWGGYDESREVRLRYGKELGYETNERGFELSGPRYFRLFRDVTVDLISSYGVNQFKIDGTGNVNSAVENSEFDSDFQAAISLINEWRKIKPCLFVNLTTGTYPSPFWLLYADSIWRGAGDHDFVGIGSQRQKWITYRDAMTFAGVVQTGPLYPLNSVMLHGLIYARHARNLDTDPDGDFVDEVREYFGTGTQLQEMYITPDLLKEKDWVAIAECAKWSRANADALVDTHWIGGDPGMLEVYGWASWSPRTAILVLRNPSDKQQNFVVDIQSAFELPRGAARAFTAHSPWPVDANQASIPIVAGTPHTFVLRPFQVLTLNLVPNNFSRGNPHFRANTISKRPDLTQSTSVHEEKLN